MNPLFEENYKIYHEKVAVYLSQKIFDKSVVGCCLEAAKPGSPEEERRCPYSNTEDHVYSKRISNALDEVVYISRMLCMSPVFLNSYNHTGLWDRYFSQSAYMKYHIENWYINVIRLEDMYLILLNEVFQLGIKKELVGYEAVRTNSNLPPLMASNLKILHKASKPIRAARIMLMHHQTFFERKLYEIEKDEDLVRLMREGGRGEELAEALEDIEEWAKRFKTPLYRKSKINDILENNKGLLTYISEMLLLLEDSYMARHQELLARRKQA